ncbi:MAG TPA: Lpg1974 family pore-forming outer membrane protein [Rhabdochlamydiaceae bacterium]|jgi:hypothetical protein
MQQQFTNTWLMIVSGLLVHVASYANTPVIASRNNTSNNTLLSSTKEDNREMEAARASAYEKKRGGMLNPPARPIVEDYDFNVFGDFLIWEARENGLPISVKNKATNFTSASGYSNLQQSTVNYLDFEYDVGFRLGIDCDTAYDGWDLSLTWLSFDTDANEKETAEGNRELFASRLDPQVVNFLEANGLTTPVPIFGKAKAHWRAFLNQLDLDLGREFFVSRYLTLRPHFGLRTTWLRQRLNTNYSNGIPTAGNSTMPKIEIREKNKWWGLGIEGGLDTVWSLGAGISLYGNIAAAIESGFQKVRTMSEVEDLELVFENNKDSYRISRPILDLQLGLRWDKYLGNNSYNFGLHAGWEHHVYFSQNQFHVEQALGQFVDNQGDLTYQGWTLGAHLAF